MEIKRYIENSNISDLLEFLPNTTARLSFWGTRQIQNIKYEGYAPVDLLAQRVMKIIKDFRYEYSSEEREKGAHVVREIDRIYGDSDLKITQSNFFSRFCSAIQDFFSLFFPSVGPIRTTSLTRWVWASDCGSGFNKVFNYYTLRQFKEKYGREPEQDERGYDGAFEKIELFRAPRRYR